MSSKRLSAVLEKQIRRLCLNDFPCGNGSWRETKDGPESPETFSTAELLFLLTCPQSPWLQDESWSPQASALRRLAVLTPERLRKDCIHSYFIQLRIIDRGVSVIDDGLLKFSKLEELVLSANKISEIPAENLPSTLKILELRANRLSCLNSLTNHPPPHIQYLGLSSNNLGCREDVFHLTGRHWPQLVCLDLSDCEFQDQHALLNALSTLPCLKTLSLEENPITLAPSYPGFTVDSLPQLSHLDDSLISTEERHNFSGLAKMGDLIVNMASATVSVGKMRGIPNPLMSVDEKAPDFPVVTYSYFITYEFLSHQTPVTHLVTGHFYTGWGVLNFVAFTSSGSDFFAATYGEKLEFDTTSPVHMTADCSSDKNCEREKSKPDTGVMQVNTEETCYDVAHVSRHSTSKLRWSNCLNFKDTQTYTVSSLGRLKKFLNQGLNLTLEEEKVLLWPAASEDVPVAKPSQTAKEKKKEKEEKGGKGKESPVKSASTKDKPKVKKKKSGPELVQDTPISRILGSVHVPLQSLVRGGQKVNVICDLGVPDTDSEVEAAQTLQKDAGKNIKEDKKEEDKESKQRGGSGTVQKNSASSKGSPDNHLGTGKGRKEVTVELSVELEKWQSASEAHQLLPPHQTS